MLERTRLGFMGDINQAYRDWPSFVGPSQRVGPTSSKPENANAFSWVFSCAEMLERARWITDGIGIGKEGDWPSSGRPSPGVGPTSSKPENARAFSWVFSCPKALKQAWSFGA